MKILIMKLFTVPLFFLSISASAGNIKLFDWKLYNGVAILLPIGWTEMEPTIITNDGELFIFASTGNVIVECHKDDAYIKELNPLKINGKYIKTEGRCIGGVSYMSMVTQKGKTYLSELLKKKESISVTFSTGVEFKFPPSDMESMRKTFLDMQQAE